MVRAVLIAMLLTATGVVAKSHNVRTVVELEAAFAQLAAGDTVNIKNAGTYTLSKPLVLENIHSIKLNGRTQRDVVLDGAGAMRILELKQAQDVQIKNLVFKNGKTDNSVDDVGQGMGGAMLVHDSSAVLVSTCSFRISASAQSGGAVAIIGSKGVDIAQSAFTGNRATSFGGALAVLDSDGLVLSKNTFTGNIAQLGGALVVSGGAGGHMAENSFTGNQAAEDAPAVGLLHTSELVVDINNVFNSNTVQKEGAGWGQVYLSEGTVSYVMGVSKVRTECGGPESYKAAVAAANPEPSSTLAHRRQGRRRHERQPRPTRSKSTLKLTVLDVSVSGVPDQDPDAPDAEQPDLSDPYVVLKGVGGSTAKTSAVQDATTVLWPDTDFHLELDADAPVLVAELYDADGRDGRRGTLIGRALFDIDAPSGNATLALAPGRGGLRAARKPHDNSLGSITVRWRVDNSTAAGASAVALEESGRVGWDWDGARPTFAAGVALGSVCGAGAAIAAATLASVVLAARRASAGTGGGQGHSSLVLPQPLA